MATQGSLFRDPSPEPVRRATRLAFHCLATVTIGSDDAVLLNISERGMAVHAMSPLLRGQVAHLSFMLPDTFQLLECEAIVMWTDEEGRAGLDFCEHDSQGHMALCRWLAARFPKPAASVRRTTQQLNRQMN